MKTDAGWGVIWEVTREWVRLKAPVREGAVKEGTAGWGIMQSMRKEGEDGGKEEGDKGGDARMNGSDGKDDVKRMEVVFDEKLGKEKERGGKRRLVRYQQNPRENWGPMAKAKGGV